MSIEQVVNAVEIAIHKLPHMESLYQQAKDQAEKMQRTVQRLANDIVGLERKISILDKTAFSIELECKRKEQQLQELTAQKDRLERLIANILNGEGYTKINQIAKESVKESVKAILAENRKIISIAFTALIQTLKDDPELVNLIHNIPISKVNGYDDNNNNNISKYLELNKDRIMDLAEKNYENLIEALTNNAIDTAASSSNPTLSLPQSSSTFSAPSDQRDKYRLEEPENFDNSKGDIAD